MAKNTKKTKSETVAFRCDIPLLEKLKKSAKANGRTVSAEVHFRLEISFKEL